MKKIYTLVLFAAMAAAASAQVAKSELAGKYHLQAQYEIWDAKYADKVYAHDDFTFSLEEQADGSFRLYSFFYNGMDDTWNRLGYGATADYSPSEQLLTIHQTPWLWDEYMGQFMESYGYGQGDGPMMYFLVQKDPKKGTVTLSSAENSLGFYFSSYSNGQSQFIYAIDYPGVVKATQVPTYKSVTPETLPGDYVMTYNDLDGKACTTEFSIAAKGKDFVMTGMFGDATERTVYFDADGKGLHLLLDRPEQGGYYVGYFGSNVGDCRVTFSFDQDGRLVSDNYFSYSPDFKNWTDALDAVAVKKGAQDGIGSVAANERTTAPSTFNLAGQRIKNSANGQVVISGGKKMIR